MLMKEIKIKDLLKKSWLKDVLEYLGNFIEKVLATSLNIFSEIKYVKQIVIDS